MSSEPVRIEVVAAVHNRKQITLQCLKSLSRLNIDGLAVHSVIVDDGSTDGTSEAIRAEFPEVEIVQGDGSLWYTEGTNVGVRAALKHDPDYVLMINDDSVFDGDFLKYMAETAERHPRSVVGSLLLLWDQPHKLFQVAPVWNTWLGGWQHWYSQTVWTVPDRPWKVDLIVGNCVLVPVDAFREAGLMNSKRYPNFGDAEFTPRLKRLGWQLLIEPRAHVFCQPNAVPTRIRTMGLRKMLSALFVELGQNSNLRRRFYANIDGAPTKLAGVAAFFVFLARIIVGKNHEKDAWVQKQSEDPLTKTFASAIVNE
ncbi:MAG: glycosyltransferase [Pyrinomonadaceae bacterium]